jgi:hypothetical protein
MRRLWIVALCAACQREVLIGSNAKVAVEPKLADLGTIVLGEEVTADVALDVSFGSVKLLDVVVTPTLGDGFDVIAPPDTIEADALNPLSLRFHPTAEGFASAVIELTTDAPQPRLTFEVRARAALADLRTTPGIVDLGIVPEGEVGFGSVRVDLIGDRAVTLASATTSDTTLTVDSAFPIPILASGSADLTLSYTAPDDEPWVGRVSFVTGTATVQDVVLVRANDCGRGVPEAYDVDGDGVSACGGDCDDHNPLVHPSGVELLNGADDDCDGTTDNRTTASDDDGDGYCEDATCADGATPGDCDDTNDAIHPRTAERADNGRDDDCDGLVDPSARDADHDGFSEAGGDCDDNSTSVRPGTPESLNDLDDDCDGVIDENTPVFDDDGDGYCESMTVCIDGSTPGDCADNDAQRAPDLAEQADYLDNNCDGRIDEGTDRADDDGDGFTEQGGDCDDQDAAVSPAFSNCP